jgi:hypothetical protein
MTPLTTASTWGTTGVVLLLISPIPLFAVTPLVVDAVVAGDPGIAGALTTGDMVADVAKDLRLVGEIVLGMSWAVTGAVVWRRREASVPLMLVGIIGAATVFVATVKLANPLTPLEDFLQPFLALASGAVGMLMVRGRTAAAASTAPRPATD